MLRHVSRCIIVHMHERGNWDRIRVTAEERLTWNKASKDDLQTWQRSFTRDEVLRLLVMLIEEEAGP
jgi:hypothetical protein